MSSEEQTTETKRGKVRRCLIDPLIESGFRKPGDMTRERFDKMLVTLADELGYLREGQLDTLRAMLATKGQGKAHDAWPRLATIRALAEVVAPRPIEEHPTIVSWFGSARGPQAVEEGTLVAEFLFLEKRKRPPLGPGDWRTVREKAADWHRQERLVLDRLDRRVADDDDRQWLSWYRGVRMRAEALIPRSEDAA
ncbi:hypothetical protein ATO8_09201 [Roseivivax marinus]|jgi:hypothetical protein|uniref:Uncharacterized protein n=1 Tax=Roseivivax marinus TaxID=1379903 RepID=W4HLW8_9RHOB|nr:hypothetical protein [Roseivivax marinus]ETW13378.1 hypothetical protein ATO8_09201 [Roseivivax marinus]